MAQVMAVLTSGRKKGFTAGLLDRAIEGVNSKNVEVEKFWLPRHTLKPCLACFNCIRSQNNFCNLSDDMGKNGKGNLYQKLANTNALLIADPVYFWGPTAGAHLFFERTYPFLWTGKLNGLPFASISCATNQGMMREATRNLCKWSFQLKMRYLLGLSVHASYYEEALKQAFYLGGKLAQTALKDEKERLKMSDEEAFLYYSDTPWSPQELYIDNLTSGSGSWQDSIPFKALSEGRFKNKEGVEALQKAVSSLQEAIRLRDLGGGEVAVKKLAETAAYWTEATWKEFLEETVIEAAKPKAYRSTDSLKE